MDRSLPAPTDKEKAEPFDAALTIREDAFVAALVGACNWNAKAAAIAAGYAETYAASYASQILKKPKIIRRITETIGERNAALKVDANYVLIRLIGIELAAAALPETVNTLRLRRDTLETIGKHVDIRAFRTQIGLSNPDGGPIESVDLSVLDDDELEAYGRIARKLERQRGGGAGGDDTSEEEDAEGAEA